MADEPDKNKHKTLTRMRPAAQAWNWQTSSKKDTNGCCCEFGNTFVSVLATSLSIFPDAPVLEWAGPVAIKHVHQCPNVGVPSCWSESPFTVPMPSERDVCSQQSPDDAFIGAALVAASWKHAVIN
jgi:hypothetical protein